MALFPVISSLATIDLYCHFGTHDCTQGTTCAVAAVVETYRQEATGIQLVRQGDCTFGAECYADLTTLASPLIDFNVSLHMVLCALPAILRNSIPNLLILQVRLPPVVVGGRMRGDAQSRRPLFRPVMHVDFLCNPALG